MGISVKEIENGDKRRVTEPYTYNDGTVIPEGYEFDGGSVPRVFWRICAPFKHVTCFAHHDWHCGIARMMCLDDGTKTASAKHHRVKADHALRVCIAEREGDFIGFLVWTGVRAGSAIGSGW